MHHDLPTPPSLAPDRPPLPWLLIIGLASLSLLWPLTAQWDLGHGLPRAATLLGLTAAAWIGAVGVGRVPRPVLTLTLTGVLHGLLGLVLGGVLLGGGPSVGPAAPRLLLPALATSAGTGALLGLAALGVQAVLGPRAGASTRPGEES